MKLKARPEDFIVEEEGSLALSDSPAPYAVFKLEKTSWDTFDLVDLLSRTWGVPRDAIGIGGMKDRHGRTAQRISVRGLAAGPGGKPKPLRDRNFSLTFLGWAPHPVTARDISGNSFRITMRDLTDAETRLIESNAAEVARDGFPNYFDAQRFGSARHGAGFMGREIFLGKREKALRLYFTPSRHDDRKTRALKTCVIESWGRWEKCAALSFGEYARVLACLVEHRGAFHKALERIDRRFLVFVLNAYQSHLFNELLAKWLSEVASPAGVVLTPLRSPFSVLQFYAALPAQLAQALRSAALPVPGHDTVVDDAIVRRLLDEVLAVERITLADLRVRQMRGISVGGVSRAAVVLPREFSVSAAEPDDLYPGRRKVVLTFFLPRGSYATLLVKRLLLAPAR